MCVFGRCAADKVADNGACDDATDCVNGVCMYRDGSLSSIICCSGGETIDHLDNVFCKGGGSIDAPCLGLDAMCSSEVCVDGACLAGKVADRGDCDSDSDCISNSCVYFGTDFNQKVCCPSGQTFSTQNRDVCLGAPAGAACGPDDLDNICDSQVCTEGICREGPISAGEVCEDASDCASGSCTFTTFPGSNSQLTRCCASSETIYHDGGYANRFYYCTSLPTGTACGDLNEMCASGVCTEGICRKGLVATGEVCEEDSDCENGACAYTSYPVSSGATKTCCMSGETVYHDGGNANRFYYCTSLPAGTACGSIHASVNEMCESGVCTSEGVC